MENIWQVWLNDSTIYITNKFIYKLSDCGFESSCSHLRKKAENFEFKKYKFFKRYIKVKNYKFKKYKFLAAQI